MNYEAIARSISKFRKDKGLTQEGLAEKLAYPHRLYPNGRMDNLALISPFYQNWQIFSVSIDDLFSREIEQSVTYVPETQRKNVDEMILKIRVLSADGDKVQVNLRHQF